MIQKAVAQFAASSACEGIHLPFFFTADVRQARKAGAGKLLELLRVIGRLLRIRSGGPIDLLIYPTGGPQTVPIVRDILLLPWMLLCARRVMLHFHAAGVADRFAKRKSDALRWLLERVYQRAAGAIVMAEFNRRDPAFFAINNVIVRPHRIPDAFDASVVARDSSEQPKRFLYVGHLHPDKGTDALLRAFAAVRRDEPELVLELVGEPLPPWNESHIIALIAQLGIEDAVTLSGVLTGDAKASAFGRADLFVFPTVAPYESFGLVLVEAMMWQLPIVASRWRANEEVLTTAAGAITFAVDNPLEQQMADALREAVANRAMWAEWGRANREIYLREYREEAEELWFADAVTSQIPSCTQP
jgi:glycosyltransferase involved in cell wall biosynthesis